MMRFIPGWWIVYAVLTGALCWAAILYTVLS